MNSKTAKLIRKVTAYPVHRSKRRALKRLWNSTPKPQRHELRYNIILDIAERRFT